MRTLEPTEDGFRHLLLALIKARSVAAEGGYLDLLAGFPEDGLPGLEPWTADDRTVDLLESLILGNRTCDNGLWLNLAVMVERSPGWGLHLITRGVVMPTPSEVLGLTSA
jgi:hypothetical protein